MKIQAIKNGVVINTIQAEESNLDSSIASLQAQGFTCVLNEQAGPGWTYDGNTFTAPAPVPAEVPVYAWYIDIGPLMDRLGNQRIPILASADATVQAVVKDMQARKWIDLQRVDVGQVIDLLISKGFTLDKAAILTTPVLDVENLALRKLYFS